MLDISMPKIVVNATSYSPSMVSSTCRPIMCVTAHLSLHRGDGYCKTQPEVWACTTKAGHNNFLESVVDLIDSYTLKGKDGSNIDFKCLTMINPTTSWFKIVELPTVIQEMTVPPVGKGKMVTFADNTKEADTTFDKSSAQISNLAYKTWFSRYPRC
jgi:hypothetical protein